MEKSVIITGASDGIGECLAHEFAKAGFTIGLMARRRDRLEKVASDCQMLGAPKIEIVTTDVGQFENFRTDLKKLDESLGGADYFIANAGIGGTFLPDRDNWVDLKKVIDINYLGAVAGIDLMKARMRARRRGTLVGVSSIAASRGMPMTSGYSASKAALSTYLESLRVECMGTGVNVLCVEPGFIDTPLTQKNKGSMPFRISAELAGKMIARKIMKKEKLIVVAAPYVWVRYFLKSLPIFMFDQLTKRTMAKIGRGDREI